MKNGKPLLAIVLLASWASGCHPLPAGSFEAMCPRPSNRCTVYLVRGWRDLWSGGIDQLADEIRARGLDARVFRESQWEQLASELIRRPPAQPLVLIGFSYGADDVLRISERLNARGLAVASVVTIDPVTPPAVPMNVRACYNYYQTNGVWDLFPWLRGIPLRASEPGQLTNIDIRRERSDWAEPNLSHATIAANEKLHREVIRRVISACTTNEPGK